MRITSSFLASIRFLFALAALMLGPLSAFAADTIVYVQSEAEAMADANAMYFKPPAGVDMCATYGYYQSTDLGNCVAHSGNCTVNTHWASGPQCATMNQITLKTGFIYPTTPCASGKKFVGPDVYTPCVPAGLVDNAASRQKQLGVGDTPGACTKYGNPCDAATGNKVQVEHDIVSGYGIPSFTRYYNSLNTDDAGVGVGWTWSYSRHLLFEGSYVTYVADDAAKTTFVRSGRQFLSDADVRVTLDGSGSNYVLRRPDGSAETFSLSGDFTSEITPAGLVTTKSASSQGYVVVGPFGHSLFINGTGNVRDVGMNGTTLLEFGRDGNNNGIVANFYEGSRTDQRVYYFENSTLPHAMTGIANEEGIRYANYAYDNDSGLAVSTSHLGYQTFTFTHDVNSSTVTNGLGGTDTLSFSSNLGIRNMVSRTSSFDGKSLTQDFDGSNRLVRSVNEEGRTTLFGYDSLGRIVSKTEAAGTPVERATTYDYTGQNNDLPTTITEVGRVTQIQYNSANLPVYVGITAGGATRATATSYTSAGQVETVDGPRTDASDVTSYTYWNCTSGGACGRVKSMTDAAGNTTTFDAYDFLGNLTQKTDPNGTVTTYSYNQRGSLLSVSEAGGGLSRSSTFTYDRAQRMITSLDSGGAQLSYTYLAAGMLSTVTDQLGNSVAYGYDAAGNRSVEQHKQSGTLQREIDTVFNARNYVSSINAGGSVTQFTPDALGEVTAVTDPNGKTTTSFFDALGREISSTDPLGGTTTRSYTPLDFPTSVSAPNGAQTSYTVDGLGNVTYERSPDRGVTARTLDAAGNVVSSTDARGVTKTMTYDGLNRLVTVSFPLSGESVSYLYDSCTNGRGHVCAVSDASGVTYYAYDAFGHATSTRWVAGGISLVTSYTWTVRDKIASITYPSRHVVTFGRDALQRISSASAFGMNLITGRAYRSDGLLTGQTFGNHLAETRQYDLQGRLTNWSTPNLWSQNYTYEYDANGNVISVDGASLNYDSLNRLTGGYSYDANGNRSGGAYTIAQGTNLMTAGPFGAASFDAAGNTLTDQGGGRVFSYAQSGQLASATVGGVSTIYVYNAFGQRAAKIGATTTYFVYDLLGNLITEADASGNFLVEYFRDDESRPFAAYRPSQIAYLHTDHLGTPRMGSDQNGQVSWSWFDYGFGTAAAAGSFPMNLRFAGQYSDSETGLFQNWHRFYDPTSGRYVQSDPIGLAGGNNTFAYANGNPLLYQDAQGLYAGVDDLVFTGGGALVGLIGQGVSDLMGGQMSGWQDYAGAAVGGAASGEALLYTGPIGAGLVGGAATNAAKQLLKNLTGSQCGYNATSFVADTAVGGLTGLIPGVRIAGVTAGRGSWNSTFKQMTTKLAKGSISNVSLQTALKMAGGRAVDTALVPGMGAGAVAGTYLEPYIPGYGNSCACSTSH